MHSHLIVIMALTWFFLIAGASALSTELDAQPALTGVPPVCSTDAECDAWDAQRGIVAWT